MARRPGVHGVKDVQRALRELGKAMGRPVTDAQRFAMQPLLKAAKANTPHASLKKALVLKVDRRAPKARPAVVVGGDPKNPDYRLLHLLEFGVEPHKIGSIEHPGHAAQPVMTPAFESEGANVVNRFGDRIGPEIERQAARLARKSGGR